MTTQTFPLTPAVPGFDGLPVAATTRLPDGTVHVVAFPDLDGVGPVRRTVLVGVHPDDSPPVVARRIVREGMRDVLAWLDRPPSMLTGRQVMDLLAGRPTWSAREAGR